METVCLRLIAESKRSGVVSPVYYAPTEGTVKYVQAFEWKATIVTDEDDSIVHDSNGEPLYTYEKVYLYNEDGSPMMVPEYDFTPTFSTHPRQAMLQPEDDISLVDEESIESETSLNDE